MKIRLIREQNDKLILFYNLRFSKIIIIFTLGGVSVFSKIYYLFYNISIIQSVIGYSIGIILCIQQVVSKMIKQNMKVKIENILTSLR